MPPYAITYLLLDTRLFGGVRSTIEQANRLARRGHTVRVLSLGPPPAWCRLAVPFTRVEALRADAVPDSDFVIGTYWPTVRLALESQRGIPIHYCRGYEANNPQIAPVRREAIRKTYELPTFKIAPTPFLAEFIRSSFGQRSWVVPNAIDVGDFAPSDPPHAPPWRVLIVGQGDHPIKGIQTGLDAVRILKSHGVPVELVRVSQGPMTREEHASGVIDRWIGAVAPADMPAIYRGVHILLGTSVGDEEGFDLPAIEAMASGVPTVLTDTACHRSYADGDAHTCFVPVADPAAMATAVERTLTDAALRGRLCANGLQVARRYDWEPHLDRLESVLDEIKSSWAGHATVGGASAMPSREPDVREFDTVSIVDASPPARESAATVPDSDLRRGRYQFAAQFVRGLAVIDAKCGDGAGTVLLAEANARSVIGIDRSEVPVHYAMKRCARHNLRFAVMDPSAIDLPAESADFIVALDLLDELAEPHRFVEEALRLLGARGALVVSLANQPRSRMAAASRRDGPGDRLRALLGDCFGRVVLCGQRPIGHEVRILPGDFDPDLDLAVLAMALQPQRVPFSYPVAAADVWATTQRREKKAA
jgi:glycosyltransferase involved in cell wall biosynthesis